MNCSKIQVREISNPCDRTEGVRIAKRSHAFFVLIRAAKQCRAKDKAIDGKRDEHRVD